MVHPSKITIENTCTSNNTIVPSEVTVNEKKEKDKKKKEKKDNKENRNSARAERKSKHSPARSTGRSITPVPESRFTVTSDGTIVLFDVHVFSIVITNSLLSFLNLLYCSFSSSPN
jgi:hypothetical protein